MTTSAAATAAFSLGDLVPSFLGTLLAALVAYSFARRAWRAQERRKVYADLVHALSRFVECSFDWASNYEAHPRKPDAHELERMRAELDAVRVATRDVALVGTEVMVAGVRRMVDKAEAITAWAGLDLDTTLERIAAGERLPVLAWQNIDGMIGMARVEIGTDSVPGTALAWAAEKRLAWSERRAATARR